MDNNRIDDLQKSESNRSKEKQLKNFDQNKDQNSSLDDCKNCSEKQ
ncbi:hypothetical protein [Anaerovorax odorimutans]|nr:hypothetical protein [Anaerovorax odorimutans]